MAGPTGQTPPRADRSGVAAALAAYIFWGLAPIYFKLIQSAPALEIIAHRILWSVPVLAGFLLLYFAIFVGAVHASSIGGEAGVMLLQLVFGLFWAVAGYLMAKRLRRER